MQVCAALPKSVKLKAAQNVLAMQAQVLNPNLYPRP